MEPDGAMLTNHCRSRTFRITGMPEKPTTLALGDACDACRRDRASRMALMAIRGRAKPALANLQPWLHTLRPRLEVLLEQGASEASVGRWHEAALRARTANELLAGALRPAYADPGAPERPVALPSNTYHAMRCLCMTTLALAYRALADETPTGGEPGQQRRYIADSMVCSFAALAQDPELLAQARAIAAETCSHRR